MLRKKEYKFVKIYQIQCRNWRVLLFLLKIIDSLKNIVYTLVDRRSVGGVLVLV